MSTTESYTSRVVEFCNNYLLYFSGKSFFSKYHKLE